VVHHEFGHYNLLTSLIRSMSVSVSVSYYSVFIHLGFFWGEFCFTGFWFCYHQYLGVFRLLCAEKFSALSLLLHFSICVYRCHAVYVWRMGHILEFFLAYVNFQT